MNRQRILVIALAAVLVAGGAYMWAQRSAAPAKPAPTTAAKKPVAGTKPTAPRPGAKPGTATAPASAPASAANAPKPAAVPASKPAPAATTPKPVVETKAASQPSKSAPVAPAVSTAAAPTPVVTAALAAPAPWQDQLQKGSYLSEKLRARLPEGTDVLAASNGFRDLQQFVATATAAHNLKLNFEELKRRVLTDRKGLANAIDGMKKVASSTIEEQRAEYEARGLIQEAKMQPAPAPSAAKTAATKDQPKKPLRTPSGS